MAKVEIELNSPAIRSLLKSAEVEAYIGGKASRIASRCGQGYLHDTHQMPGRVVASVYTATEEAKQDNLDNNTILRNLYD